MQVNGRPATFQRRDEPADALGFSFAWRLDPSSTVGRAMAAANQRLRSTGSESPRLDAEILLAHVVKVDRAYLYAHPERPLSADERAQYEMLIERRRRREPVAYLIGSRSFYGLDFEVDPRVLIPRPETELLVDYAVAGVDALGNRVSVMWDTSRQLNGQNGSGHTVYYQMPEIEGVRIADIGTGCGAIAVSIALHCPNALIYASDISTAALAVARRNVQRHRVEDQVTLLQGNLLESLPQVVDILAANLPYIPTQEIEHLAPEIVQFEPRRALDGGRDGVVLIEQLLNQAPTVVRPGGLVLLEIGSDQGLIVAEMARQAFPEAEIHVKRDMAGLDRLVHIQVP